jgi:hypothetical protein
MNTLQQEESPAVISAEMEEMEEINFFFGDKTQPQWDNDPAQNYTATDNVWLPVINLLDNETETILILTNTNQTNTLFQNLIDTIQNAFTNSNSTLSADFTFSTHIELTPRSCPSDATRYFDQALREANPEANISSRVVRSGSTLCDNDCPCSSTRHLATVPIEIRTVSSAHTLRMPTKHQFPMSYNVISESF